MPCPHIQGLKNRMPDPLSNLTLSDLYTGFDPNLVNAALEFTYNSHVLDMELNDQGVLSAMVIDGKVKYYPMIHNESDQLYMTCDCPANVKACAHELALLIAWFSSPQTPGKSRSSVVDLQPLTQKNSRTLLPQVTPTMIHADWQQRLESLTVKEIRDLAVLYQVKLKGIKRSEILQGMLDVLDNPAQLGAAIQRLQPDTRRLLDLLCVLADLPIFYSPTQYGPSLEIALDNGLKARPINVCLAELAQYKLFQYSSGSGRLAIPLAVLALALPNPALFKPLDGAEPARISPAQPFHFTRLALRLLLLAQGGWLTFNPIRDPSGWPRDADIQISAEPAVINSKTQVLLQGEDGTREQFEMAARLNEAESLWQRQKAPAVEESPRTPGGSTVRLSSHLNKWLQLSAQEQSRRFFERVLNLPSSLEMDLASQAGNFRMARSSGSTLSYPQYLNTLCQARLLLARLLARTPAGQWIELESILRTMYGLQPDWVVDFTRRLHTPVPNPRNREPATVYPSIAGQRVEPQDYAGWRKTYGRFHQAILVNTFHWLGLLDVGYPAGTSGSQDAPRGPGEMVLKARESRLESPRSGRDVFESIAVRLTRFGEFLLGRQAGFPAAPPEPAEKALVFAQDGALELDLDAAPLELVNLIVQIAAPEIGVRGANPEPPAYPAEKGLPRQKGLPRRFRYYLSDRGLGQAFESGQSLDQITASLRAASGTALPAALNRRMQPLWERYGRLQLYEDLALIQFGDDFCLPELLAATRLSQILLFTFSPRLIAIRPEAAAGFLEELRSKGYTPRLEGSIDA